MKTAVDSRSLLRIAAAAVATAILIAATGCSLSRPAPVKHTFLIDPPAPAAMSRAHPGILRVGAINVAAPFRAKAFVYRTSALGFEADFYSEFLVAPAAMIGEATARGLDRAGVFAKVIPPGALPDGDFVLDGFVSALYGDVRDPAQPAAELAITYFLTRNDGVSQAPFWSREYRRRTPATDATPEGHARALSAALGEILVELARDLAQNAPAAR
jgi:cholesterol transport system auxiliary component